MPLIYPSFEELSQQIVAEFRTQLPSVDPTVFGTWALSFANGNAALAQSIMFLVRDLERQLFPQTATGEFLDQWGWYENLPRLDASGSTGNIVVTGTPTTTTILDGTSFESSSGVIYNSVGDKTITAVSQAASFSQVGSSTVHGVTSSDHGLATGMTVDVIGTPLGVYDGTYQITVIGPKIFQFSNTGLGTNQLGYFEADYVSVPVEAQSTGKETNLYLGSQLNFVTPLSGADDPALVSYYGLIGGADLETDEAYRSRIILSRSVIEGVFTPDQIKLAVLSYPGNTRVWVKKPTSGAPGGAIYPEAGQCSVYFMRDDTAPNAGEVSDTKDLIISEGSMPANMVEDDLFVQAPTLTAVPFTFTALSPDSPTMRTAVENQLEAFFADSLDFEEDVLLTALYAALYNTQDLETGEFIESFTFNPPGSDTTIAAGALGSLGTITWSI